MNSVKSKIFDAAVIGAGASGMMAGAAAGQSGASVIVIDGNDKTGKKLYAAGNGRCNFTNMKCRDILSEEGPAFNMYNSQEDGFVADVMRQFTVDDTVEFFKKNGMMYREEGEGRCYPYSGQAAAVPAVLERAAADAGVKLLLGDRVAEVSYDDGADCFKILCESGAVIKSRALVVAAGGRAGLAFGSTGDGYGFAKAFGHTLAAPRPALAAVESADTFMPALKGVRARAAAAAVLEGKIVAEDSGEIQFTGTGISGICIFDLTRFIDAPRPAKKKKKQKQNSDVQEKHYDILVDFVPEMSRKDLIQFMENSACKICSGSDVGILTDILAGIVNRKLASVIAEIAVSKGDSLKLSHDVAGSEYNASEGRMQVYIRRASRILKHMKINVSHTKGWDDAQVTCGGVRRTEIDSATMESRIRPGLFFCGEVADVDGRCGGYNLQWAWSSGYIAGLNAAGFSRQMRECETNHGKAE